MYRTIAQLDSLTSSLANTFPQIVTRIQLPEASVQGRPVHALRMRAGGGPDRRGVLLVGGTHARELMNPDATVELAVDLLRSYRSGTDVVYGGKTWPAHDIRVVLETVDLWIVPCSNPDGRHHVMTVDDLWRKNRRDNAGTPCDGVDLNRNLDILWGVAQGQTSCSPCADIYCGPSAFSEPETRNIKHLLDTHRMVSFVDVHSYSELILHPWGHAPTQSTDPTKRFTTLPSGTCTASIPAGYQEYMDPRDRERFETVGKRIVDGIAAVRGRNYVRQTGVALYPTTGTHSDYAYARHIASPTLHKTYGFTFETGPWVGNTRDSFHPADPEPVKNDAKAGMLTLIQQSVCAIELIGLRLLRRDTEVAALRKVRDELLATTRSGREWIALFERIQFPVVALVLADKKRSATTAWLLEKAGALLADDQSVIGPQETEKASRLLGELAAKSPSASQRKDLEAVARRVRQLAGRSSREAVQALMQTSPHTK
jgi:murein tripeptide amidase MpaA